MKKGLTLVEVVIASAIILASVVVLLGVHGLYLKTALEGVQTVKATYLAEEALEAIRFLRDDSWSAKISPLTNGSNYFPSWTGSTWQLNPGLGYVDNFERKIIFSAVSRDGNSDIVSSGGTVDPDTKLVTASVSWLKGGATTTRSVSTYLTNIYEN